MTIGRAREPDNEHGGAFLKYLAILLSLRIFLWLVLSKVFLMGFSDIRGGGREEVFEQVAGELGVD